MLITAKRGSRLKLPAQTQTPHRPNLRMRRSWQWIASCANTSHANRAGNKQGLPSLAQRKRSTEPGHFAGSVVATGFKADTSNTRIELFHRYRLTIKQAVAAAMQMMAARRDHATRAARSRTCWSSGGIMPSAPWLRNISDRITNLVNRLSYSANETRRLPYFIARFTAASKLAFAEPGRSGLGWLSCGAQPDSQMMSKLARTRPSRSEKRRA